MKCPNCGAENPEGVKFCGECGKSLQEGLVCTQCGHTNPPGVKFCHECGSQLTGPVSKEPPVTSKPSTVEPTSFVNSRYQVIRKLGEGGKKKVYLVHDNVLDRDAAFALIKTENLDEDGRKRVTREARAMGKLGDNPHIVSIFDMGEINGQPYIVIPVMGGGDVEGLIEKAPDHKLPLDQTISIARAVCRGLVFAHSKGVVHRDLKPGNVWLADDGTAKIGDFGLAVMTDVSRLTMEGMMVGTVSYMPPEQAMGGEVTPKADLYSLGAMLYEMVTGRPPFVGDDYVSIIGQHINTQPISPTWHRADLPPAFESLIMLLLEKDPEKRPGSAKDVLAALESIEKGDIKESVEQQTPTENPLYRRIFVGRENELKTLQNTFTGAMSGQGALTMVVGEPGIGKTSLCEEISTFVTLRGGMTLWGHCYEEGSLSLPYLAFVEAIRSYVLDRETDELKKELGSGASDVARIVSEIREKLHVEPREAQNPEEDRYRLMQAVASFLSNAAKVKPMLIILEDLHDADKGTLEMLSYVSRNLTGKRLLIIGTYRDVEVDRSHPLSAALAELRRVSSFGRILLRGLNVDEVRRMLARITHKEIPVGLAEAVHRQTEGNPLFVQEVVRYLTEEKLLVTSGGRMKTSDITQIEMNIPEGLRDVIGKRLTNLSEECNKVLSIAAVIGREFRLDVLEKVAGITGDAMYQVLEEAKGAAIVEERSAVGAAITYRFAHAFFRQTLYEEIIAPRRIRLHQQVAQTLEKNYASRLTEHAVELAEHFSYSPDLSDLGKAVEYGEMAAQRAMNVYDYGEAVRLLERALKVQEVFAPDDKARQCDLLMALCVALYAIPDIERVIVEAESAFTLAESINDGTRAAMACWYGAMGVFQQTGMNLLDSPEAVRWQERMDRYAQPDSLVRVLADTFQGVMKFWRGEREASIEHFNQAYELVNRLGDTDTMILVNNRILAFFNTPKFLDRRVQIVDNFWNSPRTGIKDMERLATALQHTGSVSLMTGQRQVAEEAWKELRELAVRTENIYYKLMSLAMDSILIFLDGNLEETVETADRIRTVSEEAGVTGSTDLYLRCAGMKALFYMGTSTEDITEHDPRFWDKQVYSDVRHCLAYAHIGRSQDAISILERDMVNRPGFNTDNDWTSIWEDVFYLEASVLTGHKKAAEMLLNHLDVPGLCTTGWDVPTCIPRHLGSAATLLGRYDDAREHYKTSFRVCTEMNFRPELALTHLNFAELLLDHFPKEKAEALEHLDFAIKEFREMKMQPSLERALRRKDILKA